MKEKCHVKESFLFFEILFKTKICESLKIVTKAQNVLNLIEAQKFKKYCKLINENGNIERSKFCKIINKMEASKEANLLFKS